MTWIEQCQDAKGIENYSSKVPIIDFLPCYLERKSFLVVECSTKEEVQKILKTFDIEAQAFGILKPKGKYVVVVN